MSANVQSRAKSALAYSQQQVDRVVSPPNRQKAYDSTLAFANESPILFCFVATQVLFSLLPLVVFVGFATSTVIFALFAAIAFSLFWIGIALLFLVPALFVTSGVAILVWIWSVPTFYAGRWIYNKLPNNVHEDMQLEMPGGKQVIFEHKPSTNGEGGPKFDNIKAEAVEVKE